MKKIAGFVLLVFIVLSIHAYAADFQMLDMRHKIFEEAKLIKGLLPKSRNAVLLTGMFDSCILSATQIDAYFSMLGIYESMKKTAPIDTAASFLTSWLTGMKNTNELNMRNLDNVMSPLDPKEKVHVARLKGYFVQLNTLLDVEMGKIYALKKTAKPLPKK